MLVFNSSPVHRQTLISNSMKKKKLDQSSFSDKILYNKKGVSDDNVNLDMVWCVIYFRAG